MGKKIYQNYDWHFKENFEACDLNIGNFNNFIKVNVPHTNKQTPLNNFDETISHITSIYKKIININDLSKIYHLVFEGIGHYSQIYVNGILLKEHRCGYTRITVDITNHIVIGDNEISVVVDSHEINQPPFGFVIDYLCFGGIYRDCYLNVLNTNYITDYYFHNDKQYFYIDYKSIKSTSLNVIIKDLDTIIYNKTFNNEEIKDNINQFTLWDIDNPKLYNLELNLIENDTIIDSITTKIGFRTVEFKEFGFYLNDKLIKIRGANRHQSYPYVGYAMPKRAQYEDAELIKELGFNAVRTSHYPQSPDFLDKCDELGLLVFEEIPGWQNVGDESWQAIAVENVKDMIIRDKNHPSIILWGVRINESGDYHDFYTKTNEIAHDLDPYRQTGGVRCFPHSELLEDVYTYNDFVNTGGDTYLRNKCDITTSSKPYLVTEYGGHMFPTKSFDNETRRTQHAMLHANVIKRALEDDLITGTFAWCFADYNTHHDFGSGDLICYHGVCDIFRNIKYAAYPYMTYKKEPFLEITSNFNIGEHNGGYFRNFAIMTNCDCVKMYHNNILVNTFNVIDRCFMVNVEMMLKNILLEVEGLSFETATKYIDNINAILKYDGIVTNEVIKEFGLEQSWKAFGLYGKYVSNWGSRATAYKFEGYQNNELVKTIYKGPQYLDYIKLSVSTNELITKDSYDVCKITLEAIGNLGNRVDYAFDSFKIETNSDIEIIGDSIISLIGGVRSFYVKSKVKNGLGKVNIINDKYKFDTIILQIKEA